MNKGSYAGVAGGHSMKAMKFPEAGKAEIVEVPVPTPAYW